MTSIQQHDIDQAIASRAEVVAAMGTDRGYAGHFLQTDRPCPLCSVVGLKTNGRTIPRLKLRVPDGVVTEALVCDVHDEVN